MSNNFDVWNRPLEFSTKPFTYHYAQPQEYRYSLDSIEFIWRLGQFLNEQDSKREMRVLDLCSGCGVLGFELNYWCSDRIKSVDFVEIQPEYLPFFEKNRVITQTDHRPFRFHCVNFNQLNQQEEFQKKFDLIICNPPYFRIETASLGQSTFRNRCHFLIDGSFAELCSSIFACLADDGEAYVLLKDLSTQGVDQVKQMRELSMGAHSIEVLGRVRGVPLVRIRSASTSSFLQVKS